MATRARWLRRGRGMGTIALAAALIGLGLCGPTAGAGLIGCSTLVCGPPSVSAPTVVVNSPQSATFTATINPHNVDTQYQFRHVPAGTPSDPVDGTSTLATVPASGSPVTVSLTVTDLIPGTTYDVTIIANNGYGADGSTGYVPVKSAATQFATGLMPAVPVTLRVNRTQLPLGAVPAVSAQIGSGGDPSTGVQLQAAYPPSSKFATIAQGTVSNRGAIQWSQGPA